MDRWSLPGPAGFINEVVEALRDGANVVIGASLPSCANLAFTLEDRLAEDWRITGPLIASDLTPLDQLYAAHDVEDHPSSRRSVGAFLASVESKRIVVVTGVTPLEWPPWKKFVDEYASASRAVAAVDRTQLLVITAGVPKVALPAKAPALSLLIWDGVVGEADVFSYVVQSLRRQNKRVDARAKLIARIITRLALWDFDIVDRLLELDSRELFDPKSAVAAAASAMPDLNCQSDAWEDGGTAEFDGETLQHSISLLKGGDPKGELAMRLWAAQASELLPALEVNRRRLAKRMKDARLRLPVTINGEKIHDLVDIEIGPLLHLARVNKLPSDIVRIAEKYCSLRNKLAHLAPLNADEAMDPEILNTSWRQ